MVSLGTAGLICGRGLRPGRGGHGRWAGSLSVYPSWWKLFIFHSGCAVQAMIRAGLLNRSRNRCSVRLQRTNQQRPMPVPELMGTGWAGAVPGIWGGVGRTGGRNLFPPSFPPSLLPSTHTRVRSHPPALPCHAGVQLDAAGGENFPNFTSKKPSPSTQNGDATWLQTTRISPRTGRDARHIPAHFISDQTSEGPASHELNDFN